jgi:hypothetical protein
MPRADGATQIETREIEAPPGCKDLQVTWYDNGVITVRVLKGGPMLLEQLQNRGEGKRVIVVLKPDEAFSDSVEVQAARVRRLMHAKDATPEEPE